MKNYTLRVLLAAALTATPASAQSSPVAHAPIGVMGDHMHGPKEMMFSYRYMRMAMGGSRDGTTSLADQAVVNANGAYRYMVTPTDMPMDMHMVGVMYGASELVTLTAMGGFVSNSMDHLTRMGGSFTTESSGVADTRLGALIGLVHGGIDIHLNAGVSLPTGSIDERDVTPASAPNEARLPYPMQLGSGTVDLEPGITIASDDGQSGWGLQARGVYRLGENDNGYTFGNQIQATGWLQYRLFDQLSASVRLDARSWGDVDGADPTLNPAMIYTADPNLRQGSRIDLPVGFNWYFTDGPLFDHRLAVEMSIPIFQDLDGPQMETDWVLTVGWQKAFDVF